MSGAAVKRKIDKNGVTWEYFAGSSSEASSETGHHTQSSKACTVGTSRVSLSSGWF